MSLGFEKAGFKCVGAIDNFKAAIDTHRNNFPDSVTLHEDIEEINPIDFSKLINCDIDVIIGGPPCPTFSTIGLAKIKSLGRNIKNDKRNNLFISYLKYVEFFQPKIWLS